MGIVPALCVGFGSMTVFCNNKQPGYIIERKGVYSWNGAALTMIVSDIHQRRLDGHEDNGEHHKRMLNKIKVVKSKVFKPSVALKKKAIALIPKLQAKLKKMHK